MLIFFTIYPIEVRIKYEVTNYEKSKFVLRWNNENKLYGE